MDIAGRSVVVTGASSGIGRATAQRLSAAGARVYAGVRSERDAESLHAEVRGDVEPVFLDVTRSECVVALQERLARDGARVCGLINNAGTTLLGPMENVALHELRRIVEVNLIGQVAMIQALLPALRREHGRVVSISSIGGRLAAPLMGAYAASKFALEAISDALRRELHREPVTVVLIEPGAVATPIWAKTAGALAGRSDRYASLAAGVEELLVRRGTEHGVTPETVADDIHRALTVRRPAPRYVIGRDARVRALAARLAPSRLLDAGLVDAFLRAGTETDRAEPSR